MKAFCLPFLLKRPRASHCPQRNEGAAVAQADGGSPVRGKAEALASTKQKVKEGQRQRPLFSKQQL